MEKNINYIWYSGLEEPDEQREILVEYISEDVIKHEVAYYHKDTDSFCKDLFIINDVIKWCYLDELIKLIGKPSWENHYVNEENNDERLRKTTISFLKDFADKGYENAVECIEWLEKQSEKGIYDDEDILQRFSFYSYKDEPNILYLSGLYVNEKYHNKGIGTKILKVADEVAKSLNCHTIRLKTKIGSNAERLYRRNGYSTLTREGNQVWLKKHYEQKPIIDGIPTATNYDKWFKNCKLHKFNVGDWIIFNENNNSIYQVERIDNCRYYLRHYLGGTLSVHFDNELIRQWNIKDAKPGDVLIGEDGYPFIYAGNHNYTKYLTAYCGIINDGEFKISDKTELWTNDNVKPATKEQRDTLFTKMYEAGYEWNIEKKQLMRIEL